MTGNMMAIWKDNIFGIDARDLSNIYTENMYTANELLFTL